MQKSSVEPVNNLPALRRSWFACVLVPVMAVVASIASLSIGASIAKGLFPVIGAEGAAALRVSIAALILLALWRPWRFHLTGRNAGFIALYGLSLGSLNLCFYLAASTIPIGIAIAIQFIGPLLVAVASSRLATDLIWIAFAAIGIALVLPLSKTESALDPMGVAYALCAAFFWACYILFGRRAALAHRGQATALGMTVGTLLVLPIGVSHAGAELLNPFILIVGLLVAIWSSALPHSLQMLALRDLPTRTFSILLCLEPAVAALAAKIILNEELTDIQILAIGSIFIASLGSALTSRHRV